jgi:hypothetical protein
MIKLLFKKYWFYLFIFLFYQSLLYINKINKNNPISYFNFFVYFLTFLLVLESLRKTRFNKNITKLFYSFYGYLSIIMSLAVLTRNVEHYAFIFFLYIDIILKFLILLISSYLLLYSIKIYQNNESRRVFASIIVSTIIIFINYYNYIFNPSILSSNLGWTEWAVKNYITIVFSIFMLLIFWYRYYQKYFVVSEYLNSIIFIFTLSNMIEALHFIAFQWKAQILLKGQLFNLILNILMLAAWYMRLIYLNSDISIENERYLMNFQFLNGFVPKPRKSLFSKLIPFFSINNLTAVIFGAIILLVGLLLIKKITIFLLLNTVVILITVLLALFFSFSSLKRDWQNQIGILFKSKKSE